MANPSIISITFSSPNKIRDPKVATVSYVAESLPSSHPLPKNTGFSPAK